MQSPYAPYAPPQQQPSFSAYVPYEPLGWKTHASCAGMFALVVLQLLVSVLSMAVGDRIQQNLVLVGALGLLSLLVTVVTLATTIVFLVWTHQAAKNVRAFGQQGLEFTPGWCVGWWFIPIASLWKPYQALKEIWRASDPESVDGDPGKWTTGSVPSLFPLWWATYLLNGVFATIGALGQMFHNAQNPQMPEVGGGVPALIGNFFMVIAGVAIVTIMRQLTMLQEVSWQKVQARAAAPAAAGYAGAGSDGWSGYGPPGGAR